MSGPISVTTATDQTLLLLQEVGNEKLLEVVTAQLKALSVQNESPMIRHERLQIVQRVINAAIVIRKERVMQEQLALITREAKQVSAATQKRLQEDQQHLLQEQQVQRDAIEEQFSTIDKTQNATIGIIQSRIDDTDTRLTKTQANLSKTELELQEKLLHEQALIAHSRSLAQALGQ